MEHGPPLGGGCGSLERGGVGAHAAPIRERERTVDGLAARTVTVIKSFPRGPSGRNSPDEQVRGQAHPPHPPKG